MNIEEINWIKIKGLAQGHVKDQHGYSPTDIATDVVLFIKDNFSELFPFPAITALTSHTSGSKTADEWLKTEDDIIKWAYKEHQVSCDPVSVRFSCTYFQRYAAQFQHIPVSEVKSGEELKYGQCIVAAVGKSHDQILTTLDEWDSLYNSGENAGRYTLIASFASHQVEIEVKQAPVQFFFVNIQRYCSDEQIDTLCEMLKPHPVEPSQPVKELSEISDDDLEKVMYIITGKKCLANEVGIGFNGVTNTNYFHFIPYTEEDFYFNLLPYKAVDFLRFRNYNIPNTFAPANVGVSVDWEKIEEEIAKEPFMSKYQARAIADHLKSHLNVAGNVVTNWDDVQNELIEKGYWGVTIETSAGLKYLSERFILTRKP